MFFGESGKNKVGLGNGKKCEMGLRSLAAAEDAARPYRNQRLVNLISGAFGVGVRFTETKQTLLLIVLHVVPSQRQA